MTHTQPYNTMDPTLSTTNPSTNAKVAHGGTPLGAPPCSLLFDTGLRPTPTTASFEQWWADYGEKCETLFSKLGIKAAVERGFFAGHESSDSTLSKLNSASPNHSEGVLCPTP